jgi:hypothetical protein
MELEVNKWEPCKLSIIDYQNVKKISTDDFNRMYIKILSAISGGREETRKEKIEELLKDEMF